MFWDDAEPEEKNKKAKGQAEAGESLDDIKKKEAKQEDKKEEGKADKKQGGKEPENENRAGNEPKTKAPEAKEQEAPKKGGMFGGIFGGSGDKPTNEAKDKPINESKDKEATESKDKPTEKKEKNSPPASENGQPPDAKTIYSDENRDDNTEYGFIPSKSKEEEKSEVLFGITRIIASAPVVVSFLSLSHLIRKIPKAYLMIGCAFASIHFILSFILISDIVKEDESKSVSYSSITSQCFPLSLIVDIYLFIMKFLTCIFMIDMFLECIYSIFPDIRLDEFSLGFSKIFFLVLISCLLAFLVFIYKAIPMILHCSHIVVIVAGVLFLICISIYSKFGVRKFITPKSYSEDADIMSILFLGFSFISFSCECQSVSVMVFKRGRSAALLISLCGVVCIFLFLSLLVYFGDWVLQMSLSEALNVILPSYSDLNRFLKDSKKDSFNLLSRTSFLSCSIISLIGFVLQINILSRSLISIFSFLQRVSNIIGLLVVFTLVLILVSLVVAKDIGRMLWWSTKILFFGFPFYSMYPYVAEMAQNNSNKFYFAFSIIGILFTCVFVYLSFSQVSILNPNTML